MKRLEAFPTGVFYVKGLEAFPTGVFYVKGLEGFPTGVFYWDWRERERISRWISEVPS